MLSWDLDSSNPLITPEAMLVYYRRLLGTEQGDLELPDLVVATFQRMALDHLVRAIGAEAPVRWPTPAFWPLARGNFRGRRLAVVRIPIGAPAAALALELMIAAGVRTILAVGSCGSLQPDLPVGSLVVAAEAVRHEGTSHHYLPADKPATASPGLVDALVSAALRHGMPKPAVGRCWTTDAPYRECADTVARQRASGTLAVEMEAAALYTVALHRGIHAALVAAVSDELGDQWSPGFHTLAYRRGLLAAADVALEAAESV